MIKSNDNNSALRRLLSGSVSLSGLFNSEAGNDASELRSGEQLGSGQSNAGRMGTMRLRPYSLEEKLMALKRMIAKGEIAFSARVSMDMIKSELKKPEHDGLGVKQMAAVLEEKRLVMKVRAPKQALKFPTLAMVL